MKNGTLTGKRIIVTGPTSGIGKEIAIQLAALGGELILPCRDMERGKETSAEIARRTGSTSCVVMQIDTSSQQSIREFAQQYIESNARLDVLINNAAVNRRHRETSVDGIELAFATNVMGYFLLTRELLDLLRASAPARIINVASSFTREPDLTDLEFKRRPYRARDAYAQSKACDRMLTWALARRLEGSGVMANAMTPGVVQTGLYRDTTPTVRLIMRVVGLFYGRSAAQGADTAVWLASSPEVAGTSGRFFNERQEIPCEFKNVENEDKLWSICEGLTRSA